MRTDIEAAVIAAALGAFARGCAGDAIADAALGLDGAVVGVLSAAGVWVPETLS